MVVERPRLDPDPQGRYVYFNLRKKGYTTLRAVHSIARALGIDPKRIGYCGSKDKQAVTEQTLSAGDIAPERLAGLRMPGMEISIIGRGNRPLRLGDLEGNSFSITVREIDEPPKPMDSFINYYGSQRFGRHNAAVGRALIRRKYVEAITMICESSQDHAEELHSFIGLHPTNPIGALRLLPKTLLMLYVHAYQAAMWNESVDKYLEAGGKMNICPLIGFGTQSEDPLLSRIIDDILTREGLTLRDFVFRDMPELCSEGGERMIRVAVTGLRVGPAQANDLGPKQKALVEFSLPPGSYATVFIDQLFAEGRA